MVKIMFLLLLSMIVVRQADAIQGGQTFSLKGPAQQIRNVYSSTNVTTGAYVQLTSSLAFTSTAIEVFDSSGQTLQIATGAPGSEAVQFQIFPGGNGMVPLLIKQGTRIAVKAISGTANSGELTINLYR
jgi:hypothetical protein